MKRRVLKLCLFLLLGAIINVAVAWGITLVHGSSQEIRNAISGLSSRNARPMTVAEEQWYHIKEQQGFGAHLAPPLTREKYGAASQQGIGWQETLFIEFFRGGFRGKSKFQLPNGKWVDAENTGSGYTTALSRFESGWPTKSLFIAFGTSTSAPPQTRRDSGWALPPCWGLFPKLNGYVVPVDPVLSSFAINTVFYAAIVWMLFAFPWTVRHFRRRRRIKHGLCPACAYPVGDSVVCTECGKAVKA